MAVYPLVLHAETLLDEGSASDLPASLMKFQEARELAPAYARSYCGISHCNLEMALRGASPSSTLVSIAKEAALRAIELDAEMIESYSCLGGAQALEWDWGNAEKSFLHGAEPGSARFRLTAVRTVSRGPGTVRSKRRITWRPRNTSIPFPIVRRWLAPSFCISRGDLRRGYVRCRSH